MVLRDIFDAAQEGTFEEFYSLYRGDVNQITHEKLNLLNMVLTSNTLLDEKLKIIQFLIDEKIDVNCLESDNRNDLHNLFQFKANWRVDVEYATKVMSMLLKAGINVNQVDKYGAIPLIAAITVLKLTTKEALPLYEMLIASGSDIHRKDFQGKSAIDYAREFSWRQDLLSENGGLLADE